MFAGLLLASFCEIIYSKVFILINENRVLLLEKDVSKWEIARSNLNDTNSLSSNRESHDFSISIDSRRNISTEKLLIL